MKKIAILIALVFSLCDFPPARADDKLGDSCKRAREINDNGIASASCDDHQVDTKEQCDAHCASSGSVAKCKTDCKFCWALNQEKQRIEAECGADQ